MAIQNRTTTLPGIWAENAQTTIPTPPVAGVTYRDTTLNSTAIDKAWPFKTIVDSSDFNQHAFLQDTLIKEAEQYGIMRWNNTTTYKEGGFCLGQDGKLYQAKRDNQDKEPTASSDDWGIYPELSPYQLKSNLSQVLDSSTEKYPSNKAVQDGLAKRKLIGYEKFRQYTANGNLTVNLQDTDEIIDIVITANSTITFDVSNVTTPEISFYTVQFKLRPAGLLTISLVVAGLTEGAPVVWVNGNVADFSDGKAHWLVLRTWSGKNYALWSDAGTEG